MIETTLMWPVVGLLGLMVRKTSTVCAVPVIPPWLNHWFLKSSSCCRPLAVRFELTGKSQRVSLGFALWARSRYSYLCQSSCRPCGALFVDTVIRRAPSAALTAWLGGAEDVEWMRKHVSASLPGAAPPFLPRSTCRLSQSLESKCLDLSFCLPA